MVYSRRGDIDVDGAPVISSAWHIINYKLLRTDWQDSL